MAAGRRREEGASALIVVIFSVLLLVTVSVGFMRLVVQDQERTANDELSRGAYDSAIAGVEDGKRVLQACLAGNAAACTAIQNRNCNTIWAAGILAASDADNNAEVMLQNSSGTEGGFDQAYTCVKISRDTPDYKANLQADTSIVVPLQTVNPFTRVVVSWYVNPGTSGIPVDIAGRPGNPLSPLESWEPVGSVRPPIIRAQLIQYAGGGFNLSDFDTNGGAHTIYLYPATAGADDTVAPLNFSTDNRRTATPNGLLNDVACSTASVRRYVCSVAIDLPNPVGGTAANRQAYLRLTSIYGATELVVRPEGTLLQDVQPSIDSTGRAANVFRRVDARVELTGADLYPRATVDITKNFCKDFSVSTTQYFAGSCDYTAPTTP